MPFGHKHEVQEEVYLVLSGGARIKLDDEVLELRPWDAVRVAPQTMRNMEAGPEGAEILAFGGCNPDNGDTEPIWDWWTD